MNHKRLWAALAIVVALGAGATWISGRFTDRRYARDEAKAQVAHEKHQEQEKESARTDTVIRTIYVHEKAITARADSLHVVGDTIGQHAVTVRDSLNMWHDRDSVHVTEAAALRLAKDSADRRADLALFNSHKWQTDAERLDGINQTLKRDLEQKNDCHVLPFVPCPTRTEALVIGGVAGALVAHNNHKIFVKLFTLGRG